MKFAITVPHSLCLENSPEHLCDTTASLIAQELGKRLNCRVFLADVNRKKY
jgi:hypothetical protein